jgi:hypothetical protein
VSLPRDGSGVRLFLEGEIKNAAVAMSRDIGAGIEFIRRSEAQQTITGVLGVINRR